MDEFCRILSHFGIEQPISGVGNYFANAPMELLSSTLKMEILLGDGIETKRMTQVAIFDYLESYCPKKRLHSSLEYKIPDEVFMNRDIIFSGSAILLRSSLKPTNHYNYKQF